MLEPRLSYESINKILKKLDTANSYQLDLIQKKCKLLLAIREPMKKSILVSNSLHQNRHAIADYYTVLVSDKRQEE